jgi:hypothetical protein
MTPPTFWNSATLLIKTVLDSKPSFWAVTRTRAGIAPRFSSPGVVTLWSPTNTVAPVGREVNVITRAISPGGSGGGAIVLPEACAFAAGVVLLAAALSLGVLGCCADAGFALAADGGCAAACGCAASGLSAGAGSTGTMRSTGTSGTAGRAGVVAAAVLDCELFASVAVLGRFAGDGAPVPSRLAAEG